MSKVIRGVLLFLCASFVLSFTVLAHEYTEEQIQAAKSWLSSHGYPPTEAGANQAYADFENGMWHDDPTVMAYLGITVAPTISPTQVPDTPNSNDVNLPTSPTDESGVAVDNSNTTVDNNDSTTSSIEAGEENSGQSELNVLTEEKTDTTESPTEEPIDEKQAEEIKKQNQEKKEDNNRRKLLTVVIIGVALLVVLAGGFVFLKKK